MVNKHPSYRMPSKVMIELELENYGYDYYIPKEIFQDLINLYSHYYFGSIKLALDDSLNHSYYSMVLFTFYNSLNYKGYEGDGPLEKAINTLSALSRTVNFRALENGEFLSSDGNDNYVDELDERDSIILNDVEDKDYDTIASIIKLSSTIGSKLPTSNSKKFVKKNQRMKTYGDIHKAKKSELVRPDFGYKLVNKRLIVLNEESKVGEEEILIYLEDASSSMVENKGYIISKAMHRMIVRDNRRVHYYRYVGNHIEFYDLKTEEEKLECFSNKKEFFLQSCNYYKLLNIITSKYSTGNVIIVTDGQDSLPQKMNTNLTFHCISPVKSTEMNRFIKYTGGKYLIV